MVEQITSMDQADVVARLSEISESILRLAKRRGATQAEVGVSRDAGLTLQVRGQALETIEFNQDNSFGISVYFGQQKGMATTTDTSQSALEAAVEAACNIAKHTQPDPFAGLADKELMATDLIDLQLDHPSAMQIDDMQQQLMVCEQAALDFGPQIDQCDGAYLTSHRHARVYANSHGFFGDSLSTRNSMSCVVIANDDQGMQRDHWYSVNRRLDQLEAPESVGSKAAERAAAMLGARSIKTEKVPVLLSPEVARGFIGHSLAAIRGGALYRKASFLQNQLHQSIFPDFVTIAERPHVIGGLASGCFDNEGVATYDRDIVTDGVLQGYVLSSYSARRLGMKTTANAGGLHNVKVSQTGQDFQQLLKQLDRGLFVTEVMGQGVNLVTGDYSRGAAGFWVERGEIQFPVHEVTIAGNLSDLFKRIVALGSDIDLRSSIHCGSLLIEEMTVAGDA